MPSWKGDYNRFRSIFSKFMDLYTKREDVKLFLEIILTLSTVSVFVIFALKPTLVTIIDLYKEIKVKEETVAKMDTKIKNLIDAQQALELERETLNLLDQAVPDNPEPAKASTQFIAVSNQSASQLISLYIGEMVFKGNGAVPKSKDKDKEELPENVDSIDITSTYDSNYENLLEAVRILEKMRRPMKIDSVKWTKNTDIDGNVSLTTTVTGRLPYINAQRPTPPPESTGTTGEEDINQVQP